MKRHFVLSVLIFTAAVFFTGCYSVFSGGTGGLVVDSESTSSPKSGIANVDVYAYTSASSRNSDFNGWQEGTIFSPAAAYYGHTTTGNDGSFTLSKLVWKEKKPDFGKDADFTTIYLLFFHENYGLTKGETVITSDSTGDTVYAELTAVRKTTLLSISIYDIANYALTDNNVFVKVTVPQTTQTLPSASEKVYEQVIAGSGTISVSYPRWKSESDKTAQKENQPEIQIEYYQSSDEITWKACANADNDEKDYAFLDEGFSIKKTIQNSAFGISLYGKSTKLSIPTVSGTYGDTEQDSNDGKRISMKARVKDSGTEFLIDCGEASTTSQAVGTNGTEKHGVFSGLGNGATWTDEAYRGKFSEAELAFYVDGESTPISTLFVRSDTSSYNVKL